MYPAGGGETFEGVCANVPPPLLTLQKGPFVSGLGLILKILNTVIFSLKKTRKRTVDIHISINANENANENCFNTN